ncbi:uncharacterized protein LOC120572822 isoform X2 [Perca fluviatilis]|uniref:uncharacterized protein LOC120572822 isoform X2 n=1 Tax=Perca fluviatilis TaxID=8168 RepID=UPI0019650A5F|nr:uncharacterized protein LOC120572822 isoform X2 [Perca fluviatilis]
MDEGGAGKATPSDGLAMGSRPKSTASVRPPSPGEEDRTDCLEKVVRVMVESQRHQQDQMEAEALRQDRRFKGVEHQFRQLQQLVRDESALTQAMGQTLAGRQQVDPPDSRPSAASDPLYNMSFLDVPSPQPRPGQHTTHRMQSSLDSTVLGLAAPLYLQQGWTPSRLSCYEEDEDIENYLTTFERLAAASQWPPETWALYLVPLLKGKARSAYVAMSLAVSRDYMKVK